MVYRDFFAFFFLFDGFCNYSLKLIQMQVSLNAILITGNMTLFGYTGKDKIKSI